MANVSVYLKEGKSIDHTPASAVTAGSIIQVGAIAAFAPSAIAASVLGAVRVSGVIRAPAVALLGNVGDNVWWDSDGTPVGGTTDGAATTRPSAGNFWIGTLVKALIATDGVADVALNKVNPNLPAWQNKAHLLVTTGALTAAAHSGGVMHVEAANQTVTLPAAVVGMEYIIQNDAADAASELKIALNGTEIVAGANLTIANGEDMYNTDTTSIRGDFLHLVANVNATSWRCVNKRGTWAATT